MSSTSNFKEWRAMLGCNPQALALYRISLGLLLTCELLLRFRFLHPFYSDDGTLPLEILMDQIDDVYEMICVHCRFGEMHMQQLLLSIQTVAAVLFTIGYKSRLMAFISWFLYLSLTLRNTWLNFILDRYFHYLLWYAIFLPPLNQCWSVSTNNKQLKQQSLQQPIVNCATILLKCQVLWIYLDAGSGKLLDPLGGWTWNADPLPALDTYARHTVGARYFYALLTPTGLRWLTPTVVWVELLAAPAALVASFIGSTTLLWTAIGLIWSLHVGIAITLRNTVLLSLVACSVYFVFLPPLVSTTTKGKSANKNGTATLQKTTTSASLWNILSCTCMTSLVAGSLWFELASAQCDQSMKHIWSTLLHNRWNVFVGAEEYVTWEIAPGLLQNGQVVDVWSKSWDVEWTMPGTGAPCTSTSRPGRWRSFPYLAGLDGREGEALWGYLCKEWNETHDAANNPELALVKYNFFMLQADVLPNMGFSETRKRLIHSHECVNRQDSSDGVGVDDIDRDDSVDTQNDHSDEL